MPHTVSRLDIVAASGIPFRVVYIPADVVNPFNEYRDRPKACVEFYDARYPHTSEGQFVADYYAETLLAGNGISSGINLHGGVPDWSIDAQAARIVEDFIRNHYSHEEL